MKNFYLITLLFYIKISKEVRILQNIGPYSLNNRNFLNFIYNEVYTILPPTSTISFISKLKIYQINEKTEQSINNNEIYCYIENQDTKKIIGTDSDNKIIEAIWNSSYNDNFRWKIRGFYNNKENKPLYVIQNKQTKKYIHRKGNQTIDCSFEMSNEILKLDNYINIQFRIIRLYKEKIQNQENNKILNNEPIDVVITYANISDINLKRKTVKSVGKKDIENGEIRYSLRSILKNIPWVRKIFIVMPNEKISFLLDNKERKKKIIYVNDKQLVGIDSSNVLLMHINYYKLKKYGLSENFIIMDDDFFIGKPLKKSDLFYEENGKVFPYLLSDKYFSLDKNKLIKKRNMVGKFKENDIRYAHNSNGFDFILYSSSLFLYKIFGEDSTRNGFPLIDVSFTHNAITAECSSIEEIYNYVKIRYEYANSFLNSTFRNARSLSLIKVYLSYVLNKYNRRVNIIKYHYYDISSNITGNYSLFVTNEGGDRKYPKYLFKKLIDQLESLFPMPTRYEKKQKKEIKKEKEKNTNSKDFADNDKIKELNNSLIFEMKNNINKLVISIKKFNEVYNIFFLVLNFKLFMNLYNLNKQLNKMKYYKSIILK